MRTTSKRWLLFVCAAVCVAWLTFSRKGTVRAQAAKPPLQRIKAEDIGTKAAIVGRLGHDLDTFLTIRGSWDRPERSGPDEPKDNRDRGVFVVAEVNGEKVDQPIRLDAQFLSGGDYLHSRKRPPSVDGEEWEIRGVERGEYRGEPPGMAKIKYPNVMPSYPYKSGFHTYFYVLDYSNPAVRKGKPKDEPK